MFRDMESFATPVALPASPHVDKVAILREAASSAARSNIAVDSRWLALDDEVLSDCGARDLMRYPDVMWG